MNVWQLHTNGREFCADCSNPKRVGVYLNVKTGNYFYGNECEAENRVKPSKVWIDDDGYICVQVK